MSSYHSITIVLKKDVSDEGIEVLLSAVRLLSPVLSAEANVVNFDETYVAEERVKKDLRQKLFKVLE